MFSFTIHCKTFLSYYTYTTLISTKSPLFQAFMSENKDNNEMRRTASDTSHNSATSYNSESPLNVIPEPIQDEEGTTFFLLDVANEAEPINVESEAPVKLKSKKSKRRKGSDNEAENDNDNDDNNSVSSRSSRSSTNSSSSSVSAQVVIDHGSSIPRRLEKNGAAHLLRSGDDESESDYAFCYTPIRRESDADSVSNHQRRLLTSLHVEHGSSHLHMMEASSSHSQQDTDISAAENDGDDDLDDEEDNEIIHRDSLSRNNVNNIIQNDHLTPNNDNHINDSNRTRRRHHKHHHRNGKSSTGLARNGNRKDQLTNNKAMVTVYTEEDDDLVDEMPRGDRERMMRHNERNYRRHHHDAGFRRRSIPRRLHKRTQRVLQTNLQSQSWSRRESLQSNRHPGLSSEEALR